MTDLPDQLPAIEVDGAVAVVTGGASGIGRAIATELLARGATVVIADVEQGALDATVTALASGPGAGSVEGVRTDVSHEASVDALASHLATHLTPHPRT